MIERGEDSPAGTKGDQFRAVLGQRSRNWVISRPKYVAGFDGSMSRNKLTPAWKTAPEA